MDEEAIGAPGRAPWDDWRFWRARLGPLLGLTLAVFALAWISITLPRELDRSAPLWTANAVVLAAVLRAETEGRRRAFLAAGFLGNLAAGLVAIPSPAMALASSGCNVLEVIIAATALRRLCGERLDLARARHLVSFVLVAGLAAPIVCAAIASVLVTLLKGPRPFEAWVIWAAADGLGAVIFTPLLLTLGDIRRQLADTPIRARGVGALLLLLGVCVALFGFRQPVGVLVPVLLLLVVFQMEMLGAVLGVLIIAVTAITMMLSPEAPLLDAPGGAVGRMLMAQVFLLGMVLIALPTASVLAQRRRLQVSATEQQRLATLAEDIAGIGYWRLDAVSREMTWSEGMFRIYGLAPGGPEVIAAGNEQIDPASLASIRRKAAESLVTGEPFEEAFTLTRPDGAVRRMHGRAVCQVDEAGRVTAIFGTTMDVTEQSEAAAAVARGEARFRTLADSVADIICESNLDGVYTYVSPACVAATGYTPEELVGQGGDFFVHPDDLAMVQGACRDLFTRRDAPPPVHLEYRIRRKDGSETWLESRPVLSRDPVTGKVIGFVDCARDITARKALEAELETARREAIEAAEVKAAFLANMSHELRTPLTSVLGFTRLALEQPELTPVSRDYIRKASNGGAALLATVNDILDFSKLEAGQVEIRPRPTGVAGLIHDTLELFSESAAAKGLTLCLETRDLPPAVALDPDRLRQLLLNLVGNAVKFSERGEILVKAAWKRRGGVLKVEVIDQGPGLSPEQQSLLFLRFSQIDGSLTRRHGGTGLGLAICRGLVEAMGGTIGVKSALGHGARFHFEIPAPRAAAAEVAEADEEALFPLGARVLVVDDHRVNRELVRAILTPLGADLTEAEDGAEAVAKAEQSAFDLILMDLRMPGLDGTGAMQAIRAGGGPNAATPILAFSADADSAGEAKRKVQGFDGDILKPLVPASLIALAAQHLSAGQNRRRAVA